MKTKTFVIILTLLLILFIAVSALIAGMLEESRIQAAVFEEEKKTVLSIFAPSRALAEEKVRDVVSAYLTLCYTKAKDEPFDEVKAAALDREARPLLTSKYFADMFRLDYESFPADDESSSIVIHRIFVDSSFIANSSNQGRVYAVAAATVITGISMGYFRSNMLFRLTVEYSGEGAARIAGVPFANPQDVFVPILFEEDEFIPSGVLSAGL